MLDDVDIKILYDGFDSTFYYVAIAPFSFVIDLAALASRREYLKLDKWLNDKLREHQVKSIFVIDQM